MSVAAVADGLGAAGSGSITVSRASSPSSRAPVRSPSSSSYSAAACPPLACSPVACAEGEALGSRARDGSTPTWTGSVVGTGAATGAGTGAGTGVGTGAGTGAGTVGADLTGG